jgi:SAM-dependent methyltransferase
MRLDYLEYLAHLGATDLHPQAGQATGQLMAALDLRPGQHLLEIGCGTGETMLRVSLAAPVAVAGVDVLPAMLAVARKRLSLAPGRASAGLALVGAGAPLPFAAGTFDRVYAESVLGFQDAAVTRALLREAHRLLKAGGRCVANEAIWRPAASGEIVAAINRACLADFGLRQASEAPWDLQDWLDLVQACGFRVVSADLLDAHAPRVQRRRTSTERLSSLLTGFYRARSFLHPALLRQRRRYRRLLERHRQDGQYIEARLFVLAKTG